jgi:hypothetical protein
MMIEMKLKIKNSKLKIKRADRPGVALLVVLFIVMAVTVLSFAFITRSDVELACGQNMVLRTNIDYLAQSGLEHAKGLLLNPQDIDAPYWAGAVRRQLCSGSDYYDVNVVQTDRCDYQITSVGYREKGGEKLGQSSLTASLRLDPVIALWMGNSGSLGSDITVNDDVYCSGSLINYGDVNGDVLTGSFTGNSPAGSISAASALSLGWPLVNIEKFTSHYTTQPVSGSLSSQPLGPYEPVRVFYSAGDLELAGDVVIDGMLLVEGDLTINGSGNVLKAGKNVPALYVTGDCFIKGSAQLSVEGLVVVDGKVNIKRGSEDIDVDISGGLFNGDGIIETVRDSAGGQDAIIYGEPVFMTDAGHTGAFFDGSDDYLQTLDNSTDLQITGNDYTFAVWVKANSSQKTWSGIFSKTNPLGSVNHWTLQFDSSNPRKLVIYHPNNYWFTGIKITDISGQWHHIAVTRSGNTMRAYLDGEPKIPGTLSDTPGAGNGHLNIGVDRTAAGSYAYKGFIDDLRIYNQALDSNDIAAIKTGQEVSGGLIANWKLDEVGQRSVTITAWPEKTAIKYWTETDEERNWSQAAGAFFKRIARN